MKKRRRLQEERNLKLVKKIRDRESRWMENKNHVISRRIIDFAEQFDRPVIMLENINLRQMRERIENPRVHSWRAGDLRGMIDIGYLMGEEILWDKGASAGTSTAWSSWKSAKNPTLRNVHEYIMVFSKETYCRENQKRSDTISGDDFLEFTKSIWRFPMASAKRVGHPAPFPAELPYRLIQLYTFEGDVVLDPFVGSGATCIAALESNRHYVGFDNKGE